MSDNNYPAEDSPNGDPATQIDLNTANLDELTAIPGVGPTMARRILAARPFDALEDLQRVNGIGPVVLERMRPYVSLAANDEPYALMVPALTELVSESEAEALEVEALPEEVLEAAPEELPVSEADARVEAEPEMEPDELALAEEPEVELEEAPEVTTEAPMESELETEPALEAEPVPAVSPPPEVPRVAPVVSDRVAAAAQPRDMVSRSQAFWLAIGVGLLALILSLVLSLGILASLNNGQLQYASPSQILELTRQLDGVRSQGEILQQDLAGLRTRVDNLETLGGRLTTVEEQTARLNAELNGIGSQVTDLQQETEAMSGQVETLSNQVQELQSQGERVETFMSRLRDLVNEIFQPEGTP